MKEGNESSTENREKLRDETLLYLVKQSNGPISEISLAMKKRGFGVGRWNGVGGKLEPGESVGDAADREASEEIGVEILSKRKVAELTFIFPHRPEWNRLVHVYFSDKWNGDTKETVEMKPEWFTSDQIPFDSMWPDDKYWFPEVIAGNFVRAVFELGENDVILKKEVHVVPSI